MRGDDGVIADGTTLAGPSFAAGEAVDHHRSRQVRHCRDRHSAEQADIVEVPRHPARSNKQAVRNVRQGVVATKAVTDRAEVSDRSLPLLVERYLFLLALRRRDLGVRLVIDLGDLLLEIRRAEAFHHADIGGHGVRVTARDDLDVLLDEIADQRRHSAAPANFPLRVAREAVSLAVPCHPQRQRDQP